MNPLITKAMGWLLLFALATAQCVAQNPEFSEFPGSSRGSDRRGFDDTSRRGNTVETNRGGPSGLRARFRTDRTQYGPGRGVEMTLELINDTTGRIVVMIQRFEYDIVVRSERTNREVWRWSANKRPGGGQIDLYGGDSRVNREIWDQRDIAGKRVPSGTYTVEATITPKETVSTKIYINDSDSGNGGDFINPERPTFPGAGGGNGGGNSTSTADMTGSMRITGTTAQNRIRFTYEATNTGRRPVTIQFRTGQQFDIEVLRLRERGDSGYDSDRFGSSSSSSRAERVWLWSEDQFFTMALTQWIAQPGDSRRFNADWSPRNLRTGTYEARAYLADRPRSPFSNNGTSIAVPGSALATVRFRVLSNGRLELASSRQPIRDDSRSWIAQSKRNRRVDETDW